jgi:hypothetical protein
LDSGLGMAASRRNRPSSGGVGKHTNMPRLHSSSAELLSSEPRRLVSGCRQRCCRARTRARTVGTPLSWRPRARPFGVGTGPKKRWHEIGDAGDRRWGTVTAERQRREGSLSPLARQPTVAPPRDVYPSASPADRRFCQRRDFFPLRSASLMTVAVKDRSSRASLKAGWGLSRRYGSDGPRRTPDSLTRSCGDRIRARRQWSLRSSAR